MENFELKISQLIDSELPLEEHAALFTKLSTDNKLRNFFNDQIKIRNNIARHYSKIEFNDELLVRPPAEKFKKALYISAAAAVFLFFVSLYNFLDKETFDQYAPIRNEISKLKSIVNKNTIRNVELDFEFYSLNKKLESFEEEMKRGPL